MMFQIGDLLELGNEIYLIRSSRWDDGYDGYVFRRPGERLLIKLVPVNPCIKEYFLEYRLSELMMSIEKKEIKHYRVKKKSAIESLRQKSAKLS